MNTVLRPELVLLAVAFLWGINPPIMKIGLISLPPLSYNAVRMMIALVCAIVVLLISKQYRPVEKRDIFKILKVSILAFLYFNPFLPWEFNGLQRVTLHLYWECCRFGWQFSIRFLSLKRR